MLSDDVKFDQADHHVLDFTGSWDGYWLELAPGDPNTSWCLFVGVWYDGFSSGFTSSGKLNIQLPFEFVQLRNYMGGGALCNVVEALSTSTGCHSVVPNHL
jgi:hypothetical protein